MYVSFSLAGRKECQVSYRLSTVDWTVEECAAAQRSAGRKKRYGVYESNIAMTAGGYAADGSNEDEDDDDVNKKPKAKRKPKKSSCRAQNMRRLPAPPLELPS